MLEWYILFSDSWKSGRPLLWGKGNTARDALRGARDGLKEEMQSGDLFLWDTIMFVVNGTVYFSGTIGKFSDDPSFGKLGW